MAKPIGKDWVDAYFEHGVDVGNRRIFLVDEIGPDNVGSLIKGIYLMDALAPKRKNVGEEEEQDEFDRRKITFIIDSEGGSVYDTLALYDVMRTVRSPIETVAVGKCMSAATLLVAAGDVRWATPNCFFMMHDIWSDNGEEKVSTRKIVFKHVEALRKTYFDLLVKHTNVTRVEMTKLCGDRADYFFDADQAVVHGLVDNLWSEKDGEE